MVPRLRARGHCQPLLCDFAPLGLGRTNLPLLPKEEPAAIWPCLQLGWSLGGTQRKAAKCACRGPSEAAAPLSHPGLQRLPRVAARSTDCPHTSAWLSPSRGDRWQLSVLRLPPFLCLPDGHQDLAAADPNEPERVRWTWLSKVVTDSGCGSSPWPALHL